MPQNADHVKKAEPSPVWAHVEIYCRALWVYAFTSFCTNVVSRYLTWHDMVTRQWCAPLTIFFTEERRSPWPPASVVNLPLDRLCGVCLLCHWPTVGMLGGVQIGESSLWSVWFNTALLGPVSLGGACPAALRRNQLSLPAVQMKWSHTVCLYIYLVSIYLSELMMKIMLFSSLSRARWEEYFKLTTSSYPA